jgi:hypothetical protein
MNRQDDRIGSNGGRFQWGSYGFLAGVIVGVLSGWFFAGFVGAFIRVALVAIAVVPVILAYIAWRRYVSPWLRPPADQSYIAPVGAIETRAVVHGAGPHSQSR